MTRDGLLRVMRAGRYAVQASVGTGFPQAAVVGIVVTDDFEVFFDTLDTSRKAVNLRRDPRIALVIGDVRDGVEATVQYEGTADEPAGGELERLKELYFARFPDGRDRAAWPGLVYVRVTPTWIRYSDFSAEPPEIVELGPGDFRAASPQRCEGSVSAFSAPARRAPAAARCPEAPPE
jgi:general stress protein 26